jgi:multidrug resistance efflux pump
MKDETMTVAQVQAALDAAQQTVERFEATLQEVKDDVARIEEKAGAAAIDSPERVNELAQELAQTQGLATVTARGLETAQKREQEAQLLLLRAQAAERRATAAELREQAQGIDDECAPLLARLSELQGGVKYIVHRRIAAVGVHSDPLPYPETPRSTILRDQAAALEQQAAALEQQAQQQRARLVELVPTPEPQPEPAA